MKRTFALILAAVGIGCLVAAVAYKAQTKKAATLIKEHVNFHYMIDDVE